MQCNDTFPIIIVSGDFSGLNTDFLEECCGLTLIVHDITHGKQVLDKVFTNHPGLLKHSTNGRRSTVSVY